MHRIAGFVTRYPWPVLLLAVVVTVLLAAGVSKVTITTDIKEFFPQDDERVLTYNRIDEEFGGAETMMVAMEADDVFEPTRLQRLAALTDALDAVSGIASVLSVSNVSEMRLNDFGLEVAPLMETIPRTQSEATALRDKLLRDEFYRGMVISDDGTAALIVLQLEYDADRSSVVREVQAVVDAYEGQGERLYLTGTPVLNEVLVSSMQSDLKRLVPLVVLILAAVLLTYFRSSRGVLLPFLTVALSLLWTIGLMGHLGKHLSPLSAVMPVILISLGNAYAIYIITRHNEEMRRTDRRAGVARTLRFVGVAVLMAGGTTVAGFLSNVGSSITMMREFGLFTAFGIFSALVVSVTVVPAVLRLLPEPRLAVPGGARPRAGLLDRLLHLVAAFSVRRAGVVAAVAGIIVVLAIVGTTRLTSDSNFFNFFDPGSEARQAYELVREKFGGSESVEVAVTGDLKEPALLVAMDAISADMQRNDALTRPVSAVDVVRRIDAAIMGEQPGAIPDSPDLVAQYYLLAEMDENNLLGRFVNMDYYQGRIQARTNDTSPRGVQAITSGIEEAVARHLPADAEATVTGMVVLLDALSDMLVKGQVTSVLLSLLTVFVIVRLLLGTWEGSGLAVLVVAAVTVANFGLMGWLEIPLDIVTVLISSIGVGVGIDFSIHIYARFQEEIRRNTEGPVDGTGDGTTDFAADGTGAGSATVPESNKGVIDAQSTDVSGWQAALQTAVTATGRAVFTNAGGVIAGFIVLAGSSFPPLRYFGVLVTFSMAMAALGALSLLPAAVSLRRRRRRTAPAAMSPRSL